MAEIRLKVPDETCEGCELKSRSDEGIDLYWQRYECKYQIAAIDAEIPHPACIAARVKPIVLRGEVFSYDAIKSDLYVTVPARHGALISFNGMSKSFEFCASKRNAKRGAKRWVAKNLPGAVIEWEDAK